MASNAPPIPLDSEKETVSQDVFQRGASISIDVKNEGPSQRVRFIEAVRNGDERMVQALLRDKGPPIRPHDITQALREASWGGHEGMVRLLIAAGADVNIDPIPCQAEKHIIESYSKLVPGRVERLLCTLDACGRTALQAAAENGHIKVVSTLLGRGADINAPASRYCGRTALQAATEGGHAEIVSTLLAAGADANAEASEYFGLTALQAAAEGGHVEILSLLLAAQADLNAKPSPHHGKTALQAAAAGGHVNSSPSPQTYHGIAAADEKSFNAPNQSSHEISPPEPSRRLSPFQSRSERYQKAGLPIPPGGNRFFHPFRASPTGTTLQAAVAVRNILSLSSSPTMDSRNPELSTPRYREPLNTQAVDGVSRHTKILSMLLDAGADVNAKPSPDRGRTALQAAAEGGHSEMISILLDFGARINAAPSPNDGRTALQAAAGSGHAEVVSMLLKDGADLNADASITHGRTALQAAAEGGHSEIVSNLLKAKAKIEVQLSENGGRTALQAAAEGGHASLVSMLINYGADVNASASKYYGRTALQAAAGGGYHEIVSILLNHNADVHAEPSESHGRSALQAAAEGGHTQILEMLLYGRHTNIPASAFHGRTALQAAAGAGHADIVSKLLGAGAYSNAPAGKHSGRTALQAAAGSGHAQIVSILLDAGSTISSPPSEFHGRTALQAAAEGGHLELVQTLLSAGAEVNVAPAKKHGRTALQAAAGAGHLEIVSILLKAGARIEAKPAEHGGSTALQAAADGGHIEVVLALLNAGANANALPSPWQGRTALQAAAEGGHATIVSILLEWGAEINAPPAKNLGRTTLQAAAGGGHVRLVSTLINAKAKIEARPLELDGRIALQAAAEGGHRHVVKCLLDAGVEVNSMDSDGATCLKWANSYPQLIRLLLDSKASLTVQDKTGATPLHWAVLGDSARSLRLLIEAGADTESQDYEDRRPLDILLDRGENAPIKLIRSLTKNGSSIQGRMLSDWRKVLNSETKDIIMITQALLADKKLNTDILATGVDRQLQQPLENASFKVDGVDSQSLLPLKQDSHNIDGDNRLSSQPLRKYSTDIDRVDQRSSQLLEINFDPSILRTLYCAAKVPLLGNIKPKALGNGTTSVVQWFWTLEQQARYDGMPTRPPIHGNGLPSHIGKTSADDTQVLLTCYVGFLFLVHNPNTEPRKRSPRSKSSAGLPFRTRLEKTEISWTLRRPSRLKGKSHPEDHVGEGKGPIFRSTDYRSSLDIGWIPDHGIDFFSLFIIDLQKKWRDLLESADRHLSANRMSILENRGRTADFIDNLLLDEKQWMRFRNLLEVHSREARDLLKVLRSNRYLSEETALYEAVTIGRRIPSEPKSINRLSKIIENFENEIGGVMSRLDAKKQEMIHLEFNLVSIYEARTSKRMGMSMKRLSWITFVFLPLMFVAALFGMNVDIVAVDPHWTWVVAIAGGIFGLVLSVWALLKIFVTWEIDRWFLRKWKGEVNSHHEDSWLESDEILHMGDLELGRPLMSEEFGSRRLLRQWTKLKNL